VRIEMRPTADIDATIKPTAQMKIQSLFAALLIGASSLLTSSLHAYGAAEKTTTVVDIAVGSPDHTTLVAAVKAAGLVETLSGKGPFTIFAPTNAAFAKLPAGTVESLLKPENKDKLVAVLTYHVVPGKVLAADVKAGKVPTVNGKEATITVKDGAVMIDGAKVVATDLVAGNGVIHVIDTVILP
jgi:uncharacterized surface protein with fasciclin (FAS1) repeats